MSGIFGIFHTDGKPLVKKHLEMMEKGLSFIKSDGADIWFDGPVGMGQLKPYGFSASVDYLSALQNPLNGMAVVADVRLHNRRELLREFDIPACSRSDFSDGNLICLSYERWGQRCPRYLDGEFAFAIWDPVDRRLFCARDHMGNRPFFYCRLKNTFVFSSHVRAIRSLNHFPIELNEHSLAAALFLTEGDKSQTYFKGIRRLKAAHILNVNEGSDRPMTMTPFWSPQPKNRQVMLTDEDYADAFREIIAKAVCKCLDDGCPTGAMLSGGLDSSAIACLAARKLVKTGQQLFSVSSVLTENHEGIESDERYYIKKVTAQEPNIVSNFVIAQGAHPFQDLESKFDRLSAPLNPFHYMDDAIADAFSASGIKTVLSGFHGDMLASYDGRDSLSCLIRQRRWITAFNCIRKQRKVQHETAAAIYRKNIIPWLLPKLPHYLGRLKLGKKEAELASPASKSFVVRFHTNSSRMREPFQVQLKSLLEYGSPAMESQAANYAALGMDIRFPYWDKGLVEFLVDIPPEQFIAGGLKRSLFRRAMKEILPETLRLRNTKHPYTPDFHRRVMSREREIKQYLNDIESDHSLMEMISCYIDTDKIRKKLESIRPARGRSDWDSDTPNIVASGIILIRFLIWMSQL